MLINGKRLSVYDATLIEREISNHEVVNINDWLEGAPSPVFHREYTRYKDIELVLLFEGNSTQEILSNIDEWVAAIRTATIEFVDLDYIYDTHFEGTIVPEKMNHNTYKVEVALLAHKTYKEEVSKAANRVLATTLDNQGTMDTQAYITIKPTVAIPSFTITGLSRKPIVLKNLEAGSTYEVDGYTMRYLRDGANDIANFEGFQFPSAKVGTNQVNFSAKTADITLSHYPQYN